MNILTNPIEGVSKKFQYTKTLKDIEEEIRLRQSIFLRRYYYHYEENLNSESNIDLSFNQKGFAATVRDDEKFKDDLLVEKNKKNGVENTKLNPGTEQELKEPDPDERVGIKKTEQHPL